MFKWRGHRVRRACANMSRRATIRASVDWNVTARVGRPFVKKYVDERELTVLFAARPQSASMEGGFSVLVDAPDRRLASRRCLALAAIAQQRQDRIRSAFSGRRRPLRRRRKKGTGARVAHRARLSWRPGKGVSGTNVRPSAGIRRARRCASTRSSSFLISDFLGDGWEPAARAVRAPPRCRRRATPLSPELSKRRDTGLHARARSRNRTRRSLVDMSSRRVPCAYAVAGRGVRSPRTTIGWRTTSSAPAPT